MDAGARHRLAARSLLGCSALVRVRLCRRCGRPIKVVRQRTIKGELVERVVPTLKGPDHRPTKAWVECPLYPGYCT